MGESLRDQLEANYEKIVAEEPAQPSGEQAPQGVDTPVEQSAETHAEPAQPDKPGRTAGRLRDEHGRLLPGKRPETTQQDPPQQAQAQPSLQPIPRPSSWKKEMWPVWDKLNKGEVLTAQEARQLAEYNVQREGEFAKGVSTYKTEWERAKPLIDAVVPHLPMFQQYGIDPAQQFSKYVEIHKSLAMGSPEQKLGTLLRIAQDYQIPVQNLFVRGQDGQIYFNQQYAQAAQPAPQQQAQQPDVRKTVQEILAQEKAVQEAAAMEADTQKYPHFAAVRETMAGILQAGLAQDLSSAYQAAIRMPQHSDIWDAMQQQQRETQEKEKAEAQRKAVEAARRNNVSPRTATPQGTTPSAKKGLRAQLEDSFDQHTGGRV